MVFSSLMHGYLADFLKTGFSGSFFHLEQMDSEPPVHGFPVVLPDVEPCSKQVQLGQHFFLAPSQEPPETVVLFDDPKHALDLNRPVDPKLDAVLRSYVRQGRVAGCNEFQVGFYFFRHVNVFAFAAFLAVGAASEALAAADFVDLPPSVLRGKGVLAVENKAPPAGAHATVAGFVVGHVLAPSYLVLEFPRLRVLVVCRFDEAGYAFAVQETVVRKALVAGVSRSGFVLLPVLLSQGADERLKRVHVAPAGVNAYAGYELGVDAYLDVVAGLELAVAHMVVFHAHESGVRVRLGIAVAAGPHGEELAFVFQPPLKDALKLLAVALELRFAASPAVRGHNPKLGHLRLHAAYGASQAAC